MAWDTARGGCLMLFDGACESIENKTASDMDRVAIGA
jgi:hypothetical protein